MKTSDNKSFKNNLFSFATSELSQDAFIAWALNWINGDRSMPLYEMAADLLKTMGETDDSISDGIIIKTQLKKIDILVTVKRQGCNRAIIIEDKTYTSEHDDQIARYRDEIMKLPTDVKTELCIDDKVAIRTVYLKTGFMYDYDKQVKSDVKVGGWQLLELLRKFRDKNEILDDYIAFLANKLNWYVDHQDFTVPENIKNHVIAQYRLMRSFFPEALWHGKGELYKVYDGSNKDGSPWTEMVIYNGTFNKSEDENKRNKYRIFWRIDKDSEGSYISLRFYDRYNKNDEYERISHLEEYGKLKRIMSEVFEKIPKELSFKVETVIPKKDKSRCKEAEIFNWHIDKYLVDWKTHGSKVVSDIRLVNELFLKGLGFTQ